jgi:hypothetical protein
VTTRGRRSVLTTRGSVLATGGSVLTTRGSVLTARGSDGFVGDDILDLRIYRALRVSSDATVENLGLSRIRTVGKGRLVEDNRDESTVIIIFPGVWCGLSILWSAILFFLFF